MQNSTSVISVDLCLLCISVLQPLHWCILWLSPIGSVQEVAQLRLQLQQAQKALAMSENMNKTLQVSVAPWRRLWVTELHHLDVPWISLYKKSGLDHLQSSPWELLTVSPTQLGSQAQVCLWVYPRDKVIYRCGKPTVWLRSYRILLQRYLDFPLEEKENAGGRGPVLVPLEGRFSPFYHWQAIKCSMLGNQATLSSPLRSQKVLPPVCQLKGHFSWRTKCEWGRCERDYLHLLSHLFIRSFIQCTGKPDTCWSLQSYF